METTHLLPVIDEKGNAHPDRSADPMPMVGHYGRHAWSPLECWRNNCEFAPRSEFE